MSLADQIRGFVDTFEPRQQRLTVRLGTISTVTAGAAADGNAAVTVTVGSTTFPAPYLAAYSPTVGHQVLVVTVDSSPVILGRVIGLPSF